MEDGRGGQRRLRGQDDLNIPAGDEFVESPVVDATYGYEFGNAGHISAGSFNQTTAPEDPARGSQQTPYASHFYPVGTYFGDGNRHSGQSFAQYSSDLYGDSHSSNPQPAGYQQQIPYSQLSQFEQRSQIIPPVLPSQIAVSQAAFRPNQRGRRRTLSDVETREQNVGDIGLRQHQVYSIDASTSHPTVFGDLGQAQQEASANRVSETQAADPNATIRQGHQLLMRQVYESIGIGELTEAARHLRDLSQSLLTRVEELGLAYDVDFSEHQNRLQFWRNFNNCWLGLLQKQLDLTEEALRDASRTQVDGSSILTHRVLREMGDELVKQCDAIEHFALVDYEQGVWEDQIVELLAHCLTVSARLEGIPSPTEAS